MVKYLAKKNSGIILIVFAIMVSACDATITAPPSHLDPCPPVSNEYTQPVEQRLTNLYEDAIRFLGDENTYNTKRQAALNRLITLTYQWSDSIDILYEGRPIRITITYLSPELAQTIILNHYLYKKVGTNPGTFNTQVQNHMAGIVTRNEHIFFVTIMSTQYDRDPKSNNYLTLNLPIRQLKLTNTANVSVYPEHDDHNLEETIVLDKPVYGLISFAMAVVNGDNGCQPVLNKDRDTRIVISIPNIKVNDAEYIIRPWEFNYSSLINIKLNHDTQKEKFTTLPQPDKCTPSEDSLLFGDLENAGYWESIARFIWLETTLDP